MSQSGKYMYILFVTGEYPPQPGGVGDYTRRLALALATCGHNISVLTADDGRWTIDDVAGQGAIVHLKSALGAQRAGWGWGCWNAMRTAIETLRPDVVHIQYQTGAYGMHPAINFFPWRLRSLPTRPPVVVTFHDLLEPYLFPKAGPLRRWVTQRLARDADGVVATNVEDLEVLAQWRGVRSEVRGEGSEVRGEGLSPLSTPHSPLPTPHSPLSLIPIGSNIPVVPPEDFDRRAWRTRMFVGQDEVLVGYFGLLGRSKGADLLLDGIEQEPTWRLLLIGGEATSPQDRGYATELLAAIDRRRLAGRVFRTGQVSAAAASAHLLAADVVALPFRDGASFRRGSLLAALGHGCAVVTTYPPQRHEGAKLFDLPELCDGVNMVLVPPEDADALYRAIKRLAEDSGLRKRLGTAAREVAAHFGWERIAAQHEAIYGLWARGNVRSLFR